MPNMDRGFRAFAQHIGVYGWKFLPSILFSETLSKFVDMTKVEYPTRFDYVKRKTNLKPILDVLRQQTPDIIILNELIYQVHVEEIEKFFTDNGYTFVWGKSLHQEHTTLSTIIATKLPSDGGAQLPIVQKAKPGSGGGFAYIRLADQPITVVGVHCSSLYEYLWSEQLEELVGFVKHERAAGRRTVIAGDFNATEEQLLARKSFEDLKIGTIDEQERWTCPVWQIGKWPHRTAIDHILAPDAWKRISFETGEFGSDHLWIHGRLDTTT